MTNTADHYAHRHQLTIAIVGHTNVGKTTLIRTLLQDQNIGEVANQRATTRHIHRNSSFISDEGQVYSIDYLDTPGMESPLYFVRAINQLHHHHVDYRSNQSLTKPLINSAIERADIQMSFPIEVNCLKQIMAADLCLYVIDTRQPILAKIRTEMQLIQSLLKPTIIIFNHSEANKEQTRAWSSYLLAHGFHNHLPLNPLTNNPNERARLYSMMELLGEEHRPLLKSIQHDVHKKRLIRCEQAADEISELLIKLAAYRIEAKDIQTYRQDNNFDLSEKIRNDIHPALLQAISKIIDCYGFSIKERDELLKKMQPAVDTLLDLKFDDIKSIIAESQTGVITGALTGAGVDAALLGSSLGLATTIGAISGGIYSARVHTARIWRQLRRGKDVGISIESQSYLLSYFHGFILELEYRGHGTTTPLSSIDLKPATDNLATFYSPILNHPAIKTARIHPEWFYTNNEEDSFRYTYQTDLRGVLKNKLRIAMEQKDTQV